MSNCKENKEEICKSYPLCYGCNSFEKPTNYDRIRNMSVEEMAKLLIRYDEEWGDFATDSGKNYLKYDEALKAEIKWLKSEVENNGKSNNL